MENTNLNTIIDRQKKSILSRLNSIDKGQYRKNKTQSGISLSELARWWRDDQSTSPSHKTQETLEEPIPSFGIWLRLVVPSAPREKMAAEEKSPDSWLGGHLKSPPYTLHSSLEPAEPPALSHRKLAIAVAGAIAVLVISIVGVLLATYLGHAACVQRDAFGYLPPQVNVQNEASLLLALSELGEQGTSPGITCDLRNHLMVYHGQPEGCVARKMEASEPLSSCQELESYFQAVLRNATLGITAEVQLVGTGALGGLATLLCSGRPTYLVGSSTASPRNSMTRRS